MLRTLLFLLAAVAVAQSVQADDGKDEDDVNVPEAFNASLKKSTRNGKLFSLFNIVTFKNDPCRSQSSIVSGGTTGSTATTTYRTGSCYAASQCLNKGGTSSGSCAAGFGVCCLFLSSVCGAQLQQNCTYIRNPGFPSDYTGTTSCSYTIQKCGNNVCQLRLDFETFSLLGPANTLEATSNSGGSCSRDLFTVTGLSTGTGNNIIPPICGQNTGQHIYVNIGGNSGDTATLNFAFTGTSSVRQWEIKVTQIPCSSNYGAPPGCLQYLTGCEGTITSFNFINSGDTSAGLQLNNQCYNTCIRQEEGMCCIQYLPCTSTPNSFTLSPTGAPATGKALIDTSCTMDYITIPGSSASCCTSGSTLTERYCGNFLNTFAGMPVTSMTICDCTNPFMVGINTDTNADKGTQNTQLSRGVCLNYVQLPCGQSNG